MQLRSSALPRSPISSTLLDDAKTLTGLFTTLVDRYADFDCLTIVDRHHRETRLSLGSLRQRARDIQASLYDRGVRPADFVLVAMPTSPELLSAYLAIILAGAVPGLVAPPSNRFADRGVYADHLAMLLTHAQARAVLCDDEVAGLLKVGRGLHDTAILTSGDITRSSTLPPIAAPQPEDIATVQYSSGSTGKPKGVLLSHRAILNNVRATLHGVGLTPDDVCVNWLPLYHDLGLIDTFLMPVLGGCRAVLIPTMDFLWDPALWLRAIHRYRGTFAIAPNFAYSVCAQRISDEELAGLDLSSWRIAMNGSEPVLAGTIRAFEQRLRPYGLRPETLSPCWGLAEGVCVNTTHPVGTPARIETIDRQRLATESIAYPTHGDGVESVSIGPGLPHCELEIRDPSSTRVPERHVGTIWLRTSSLFSGYHRDPETTAKVLIDGWLNTGDQGYLADRCLFFVSREKDLIVVGGEKYAPHDVETAINRVPGVRQGCAVAFGVLNEMRGTEDIAAVLETKETDELALAALRDAVRQEVTRATGLALRYVILVPPGGINKTTSGKLARSATKARYVDRFTE